MDGTLYYVHSDLLGSTVAVSDAAGQPLSRSHYLPYGEVYQSEYWDGSQWQEYDPATTPLPETDYLYTGHLLDRSTDLYYYGGGRYYDPRLGQFIQPDPVGGPPLLPQMQNRYAALQVTPVMRQVMDGNSGDFLGSWLRDNWYRQSASASFACATCVLSEIKTTESLFRLRYTVGEKSWTSTGLFRRVGRGTYQSLDDAAIYSTDDLLFGTFLATDLEVRWTGSRLADNTLKKLLAKPAGRLALNLGVAAVLDIGFEGLEAATGTGRWGNPYWSPQQKVRQAVVATFGDLAIVFAITWWNPELWVAIPVYFVASIGWSKIHSVLDPTAFTEHRNLKPLGP